MRLIDADALMKEVCGLKCGCMPYECEYDYNGDKYCEVAQYIESAPTAIVTNSDNPAVMKGEVSYIVLESDRRHNI